MNKNCQQVHRFSSHKVKKRDHNKHYEYPQATYEYIQVMYFLSNTILIVSNPEGKTYIQMNEQPSNT